jgi:hypothetical protein
MKNPKNCLASPVTRWCDRIFPALFPLLLAATMSARADWPNTNATKWVQYPDQSVNGIDILMSKPLMLADDFLCTNTGPVTDIHLWASWLQDMAYPVPVTLGIWTDVPTNPPVEPYSHPGQLIWSETFTPAQMQVRPWFTNQPPGEWFWDPRQQQPLEHDTIIWQYNFYPTNPFVQEGTPKNPVVYWLSVTVNLADRQVGWKTSTNHWNDDSVWVETDAEGHPLLPWKEIRDPFEPATSLDLAFALTTKAEQPGQMDFGDAPDQPYPTLLANNGARHVIVSGVRLGPAIDAETNGQPNITATGDDIAGVNDDDGVTFAGNMVPGQSYAVTVFASTAGFLNAWVDFNGDGSWAQAGDQIFINKTLVPGNNVLLFAVPSTATWGANAFARFRFDTTGGLSYTGLANDGEVEDYKMKVEPLPQHDLGDAPSGFNNSGNLPMLAYPALGVQAGFPTALLLPIPTLPYGPIHMQPTNVAYLGASVTFESNADLGPDQDLINNIVPPTGAADLDGADDGVALPLALPHCAPTAFNYTVTFPTAPPPALVRMFANVWFDWNRDGDWNDILICPDGSLAPEWAVQNQVVPIPPGPYPMVINLATPSFKAWHPALGVQPVWMRITLAETNWTAPGFSGLGGDGPLNGYAYGETEDYYITNYDAQQTFDFGDAPSPYPTLLAANGAQHLIVPNFMLGGVIDNEANGQPDPAALGDDNNGAPNDEDGVTLPAVLLINTQACVTVSLTGPAGRLDAWVDFNGNGAWDAGEQVFTNLALASGSNPGLCFNVPLNAQFGTSFARFRLSSTGGLAPTGVTTDGEVEDYLVNIAQPRPLTNVVITNITATNLTLSATQVVTLIWNAQTNIYHQVQAASYLTNSPGVWSDISPLILGPTNIFTETNPPVMQKFYRIKVPFTWP